MVMRVDDAGAIRADDAQAEPAQLRDFGADSILIVFVELSVCLLRFPLLGLFVQGFVIPVQFLCQV